MAAISQSPIAPITSFAGEYEFLSNFYRSPVEFFGETYPTVEHGFQAAKSNDASVRAAICAARTPGQAKHMGRKIPLNPAWGVLRLAVMKELLEHKFKPGSPLAERLLATGNAELVEGNTWGDRFWGVCRGSGENYLGHLLMQVRDSLRSGATT